jgi:2-polyprenyl-3-methyl-5-hydroxy-6-metoxy-1,4-benzoquinol methylase
MSRQTDSSSETRVAKRYFGSFPEDYHRAFHGSGANPLHRLINKCFRRRTFTLRTALVEEELQEYGLDDRTVLDLGCGSGEVSIIAAKLGANVLGIDIVKAMVDIARAEATAQGLAERTEFRVGDILRDELPSADVSMLVGVIEYYSDLRTLLQRVCSTTKDLLIIVDTRGPWWRRFLRYALARYKGFYVFYRSPSIVEEFAAENGFVLRRRVLGHSYTFFSFRRR